MNRTPWNKSTSQSLKITIRKLLNCVPSLWDVVKLNSLFTTNPNHFRRTCNPESLKWLNELAFEIKRRCSKNVPYWHLPIGFLLRGGGGGSYRYECSIRLWAVIKQTHSKNYCRGLSVNSSEMYGINFLCGVSQGNCFYLSLGIRVCTHFQNA